MPISQEVLDALQNGDFANQLTRDQKADLLIKLTRSDPSLLESLKPLANQGQTRRAIRTRMLRARSNCEEALARSQPIDEKLLTDIGAIIDAINALAKRHGFAKLTRKDEKTGWP
jgi:hypothetical protein